ncbi:DUF2798 domain-containing protein [Oceanospirillum linum]|uniref:DUF2798 domain-containing protein n=1 Tax=Oceanospirillum linum TaxID=966 RepID=A0A1T1H7Y2_OCELI|nr:DUF2798 domain-containing protein [Oceanospirillum linum]OOV85989.1 hypothetical protein BTA35_0215905 [Oceanospirillum linum]SEG44348.1 Protein of unknown function [Oleiphilus messinensis]SMP34335.1 Protein of unknown function [Oceanospirillum linum]
MENTAVNTSPEKRPLYQKIAVLASLILIVGGTLTGIMTYMNTGLSENFIQYWLSSFAITVLFVIPASFVLISLISKWVESLLPHHKTHHRQLVTGVAMALVMESIMAVSTTANIVGFSDSDAFAAAWLQSFAAALPFGLCMALIMSLYLKPKLAQFLAS